MEHHRKIKSEWSSRGDGAAVVDLENVPSQGAEDRDLSTKTRIGSWASAIGYTGLMSFCMAVIGSPVQGVVGRILQEESVIVACRNALLDFNIHDPQKRALTA